MQHCRSLRTLAFALAAGFAAVTAGAGDSGPDVQVLEAYTAPSGRGQTTADVFARFVNVETDDRLVGADSAICDRVELVDSAGVKLPYQEFGFREDVESSLVEGAPHLRLAGLKRPLVRGQSVPVMMHFESAGTLVLHVIVR